MAELWAELVLYGSLCGEDPVPGTVRLYNWCFRLLALRRLPQQWSREYCDAMQGAAVRSNAPCECTCELSCSNQHGRPPSSRILYTVEIL